MGNGIYLVEDGNCYKARKRQTTLPAITEPQKNRRHFDHPYANVNNHILYVLLPIFETLEKWCRTIGRFLLIAVLLIIQNL